MTAADAMHSGVATVSHDQPAHKVLRFLLDQGISGAAVIDAQKGPQGVITLADLAAHAGGLERDHPARHLADLSHPPRRDQAWQSDFHDETPVSKLMTPFLVRVHEGTPLTEVIGLMLQTGIHRVFVTRQDQLVGIISTFDLVVLLQRILENQLAVSS